MTFEVGDVVELHDITISTYLQLDGQTQEVFRNYYGQLGSVHFANEDYVAVSFVNEIVQIENQYLTLHSKAKGFFEYPCPT